MAGLAASLPRRVSAAGVVASIVYLSIGLGATAVGGIRWIDVHMRLALYGGLLLFPHSVAVAYIASAARGPLAPWAAVAAAAALPLIAAPALAVAGEPLSRLADAIIALSFAVAGASAWVVSMGRKGSARLSLRLFTLTYAASAAVAAYTTASGPYPRLSLLEPALAYTLAYPVSLIYSVTVHALPSTFKDEPASLAAWPLPVIDAASAALVLAGHVDAGVGLALAGLALYVPAARLYRVPAYTRGLRGRKPSPAVRGMAYFLWGHWAVIGVIAVVSIYTAAYLAGLGPFTLLSVLHSYTLGFASIHVAIHAPMMLPVILGIRHRRRYTPVPFILVLAALLAWPYLPAAALVLYAAGLAAAALVAWP